MSHMPWIFYNWPKLSQAFRLTMAPFNYKTQFLMRPSGHFHSTKTLGYAMDKSFLDYYTMSLDCCHVKPYIDA